MFGDRERVVGDAVASIVEPPRGGAALAVRPPPGRTQNLWPVRASPGRSAPPGVPLAIGKPDGVHILAGSPRESDGLASSRDVYPEIALPSAPSEHLGRALVGVDAHRID